MITFAIATGSALLIARRASRWTVEQHLEDMSPKGLAVDPRTPTRVYCGESGGLWRSDDAGRTWSPKLQSHVERAQRTHREEFYQVWEVDPDLPTHRAQLQAWAHIYNTIRPHKHLNYLTPLEFCEQYAQERR